MLPVWLSLWGTTLDTESRLFLGWFGPRGLASIVFGVIVMQYELVAMYEVVATAVCTVLLSVVLHGLTANPWVARFRQQDARNEN
jgi:NhaP-type Na+/H+ or K+/H+ antiporter